MGILRLFLALSVVIQHAGGQWGIGGGRAVEIFFIISGFYMGLILSNGKYQTYKTFIANRFLRIFPVYWVMLALIFLVSGLLISLGFSVGRTPFALYYAESKNFELTTWLVFVISNFFIFVQDFIHFIGLDSDNGALYLTKDFRGSSIWTCNFLFIPQAWSLSIELMFYIIAPFLLWQKGKRSIYLILSLIAMSCLFRIILLAKGYLYDPWAYRFFPTVLYLFLLGTLSYKFYASEVFQRLTKRKIAYITAGIGLLITVLYGWRAYYKKEIMNLYDNLSPLQARIWEVAELILRSTIPYLIVSLLICGLFHLTSRNRWDRWVGELSYPLYICHLAVIYLLALFFSRDFSYFPSSVAAVSLILSLFLVHWVQKPIDRYREKRLKLLTHKNKTTKIEQNSLEVQTVIS